MNGTPVYIRDIGHVRDGFAPQTNIARQNGSRAALLTVLKAGDASTLAVVGRYVLSGRIFDYLENLGSGAGGEIQLTDGIAELMKHERVLAYRYDGTRYDCGSKLGYLKATTAMGLKHLETGAEYCEFLRDIQCDITGAAK